MKKKYLISCLSMSWVGRIHWQWKYRRHRVVDILLFLSIPARLLFSLCSPLVPFSAHLNAWNKPVLTMKILHWVIEGDKKCLQIIFGQRYSINRISRFSQNRPHSWDACVVPTNMHGIWPRGPWCWVQGPSDVTVITWKHMQGMQQSLFDSQAHVVQGHRFCTKYETFLFALPAGNLCDCFLKAHSLLLSSIVTQAVTWCTWMYELITKRWCSVLGYKNYSVIFGVYSFFVRVFFRSNANSRIGQFTPSSSRPPPWVWPVDSVSCKICAYLVVQNVMSSRGMFKHPLSFSHHISLRQSSRRSN